ncbi:MAG: CoA transferase, partial [Dehalococcoidia bacterium]
YSQLRHGGRGFGIYYTGYRAKDGGLVFGTLTKANRDAIRSVLGITDDQSDDPEYDALDPMNVAATARIKQQIEEKLLTRTVAEWCEELEAAGAPVSAVNFPEEMSDDPQVAAAGIMTELEHDLTGPQRLVGPIVRMSATPPRVRNAAPTYGAHTREILDSLGYPQSEIEDLYQDGVVN